MPKGARLVGGGAAGGATAARRPGNALTRLANNAQAASSLSVRLRARAAIVDSPAQAARRQSGEVRRPPLVVLQPEFAQVVPGENAGVMPIVEYQPHRVLPDRLDRANPNLLLPAQISPLSGTVALHLGGWAFDAEILGRQGELFAVVVGDVQNLGRSIQSDLGRNRHLCQPLGRKPDGLRQIRHIGAAL